MRTSAILDVTVADTTHGASCVFAPPLDEGAMTDVQYREWLKSRLVDIAARADLSAYRRWAERVAVKETEFKGPYAAHAREFLKSPDFQKEVDRLDRSALDAAEQEAARRSKQMQTEKVPQDDLFLPLDLFN